MSTYRVLFFDNPEHRPHVALSKFDNLHDAVGHAQYLADTWTEVQVVEIVARITCNLHKPVAP